MNCQPTRVPPATEVDIPALHAKYLKERERRMRRDARADVSGAADGFARDTAMHDPFTAVAPRDGIDDEIEVAILGAGWTGVLAAYHLTNAGITDFRMIDHAGGFGGTWYWNRYPGLQCDNDAYCYLPLLEETGFMPSKQFSDGFEIYDYFQLIADKFGFRDKGLFHTQISSLKWDEAIQRWHVRTDRGDDIKARFVVMAGGTLSTPKLPNVPGIHSFKGKMFHTSRWDHEYTGGSWRDPVLSKLAGKRVAILGTGATACQAVPYLAKYAKELYVIQRTPSSIDVRVNPLTDPDWVKSLKPGWQQHRQVNFMHAANELLQREEPDLVCDIWTEINRNLNAEREAQGWFEEDMGGFMQRREVMDYRVMERLRARVDSIVKDPVTAEALKPYYRFMCKRPLSNNEFYDCFNQPHVHLIDVAESQGLQAMSENGFIHDGVEHEIDCMIFASGFEVTGDLKRRWGIDEVEGRSGISIYDHWADGPRTLHGAMAHGFPNMFYTGYVQGGLNGNTTLQFGAQGYHAAQIIKTALDQGYKSVEPSQEAVEAYLKRFREIELDLSVILNECTPSYFTNDGEKEAKWFLFRGWGHGWDNFQDMLTQWRANGEMEGLVKRA